MQDQPSAIELVGAVRDFLQNVAMPQLQGRAAFHARVAANALGIVQRELETAPEADAREHERLATILDREGTLQDLNREFCERIRNGELDLKTPNLADHLWETTLTKLAIDQPKYSAYQKAIQTPPE